LAEELGLKFDLNKIVDVNNTKILQDEINILEIESAGLYTLAKEKYPVLNSILDSFDSTVNNIDKSLSKQDDILKGIKVGVSCLIRKGS